MPDATDSPLGERILPCPFQAFRRVWTSAHSRMPFASSFSGQRLRLARLPILPIARATDKACLCEMPRLIPLQPACLHDGAGDVAKRQFIYSSHRVPLSYSSKILNFVARAELAVNDASAVLYAFLSPVAHTTGDSVTTKKPNKINAVTTVTTVTAKKQESEKKSI
jgi:hypothetical protein